jgi:hypothetical protein
MRVSSNETPVGFGGTGTGVGIGPLGVGAGPGLRGRPVAARFVLAVVVGLAVTVVAASVGVRTGAGDGEPLAPHAAITPATITAWASRLRAMVGILQRDAQA